MGVRLSELIEFERRGSIYGSKRCVPIARLLALWGGSLWARGVGKQGALEVPLEPGQLLLLGRFSFEPAGLGGRGLCSGAEGCTGSPVAGARW